ncbi:ATP-binding protein [Streptomyces sp. GESEQ-4]|uniref:ATP-binding protein n=1 Tax=Streptomyces sp. GESEQ-4 TaxID=2812655 RepID=UPI001B32E8C1|nr:ATP-binding protein [Streptomyces sp. GESEQ-4]
MPENDPEPWQYVLSIPNDPRAVTISRRTLRLILTMHGLIGLVDVAELLATELVGNAVRHTKGPVDLRVCWSAGVLRIGAWDGDPQPPEPPGQLDRIADQEEGRGLALVRACSDLWGWQPQSRYGNRGKFIWCDLAAA